VQEKKCRDCGRQISRKQSMEDAERCPKCKRKAGLPKANLSFGEALVLAKNGTHKLCVQGNGSPLLLISVREA